MNEPDEDSMQLEGDLALYVLDLLLDAKKREYERGYTRSMFEGILGLPSTSELDTVLHDLLQCGRVEVREKHWRNGAFRRYYFITADGIEYLEKADTSSSSDA